eukprot:315681-Alexandrium_andersonii.AAC.1
MAETIREDVKRLESARQQTSAKSPAKQIRRPSTSRRSASPKPTLRIARPRGSRGRSTRPRRSPP